MGYIQVFHESANNKSYLPIVITVNVLDIKFRTILTIELKSAVLRFIKRFLP